jgi:hypothetical protein
MLSFSQIAHDQWLGRKTSAFIEHVTVSFSIMHQ